MKNKKHESRKTAAPLQWPAPRAGIALAGVCGPRRGADRRVWWAYSPVAQRPVSVRRHGAAVRAARHQGEASRAWIPGVRPVTMFTYWINAQLSGERSVFLSRLSVCFT